MIIHVSFCTTCGKFRMWDKWLEQKVTYAGIKQRWLIVESAERKQSDIQKLNSKIEQEKKTVLKLGKKLETTGFDTQNSNDNSCIFLYYMRELPNVGSRT